MNRSSTRWIAVALALCVPLAAMAAQPKPVADPVARLREETVALVERNLARIEGSRRDTYARNPDYAEIGRIRENLPLLGLGSAKAGQGERLTW